MPDRKDISLQLILEMTRQVQLSEFVKGGQHLFQEKYLDCFNTDMTYVVKINPQ